MLRLAIIRQRYTPYGGAERFVEAALEALLERGVAISLYTREWPQTRLQLIEPVLCDPFHIGRLWRDWSFARAVCRAVTQKAPELVQSHERRLFASPLLKAVICNSRMVRQDIRDRFGLPDERLPVVYNAVDSEAFSPKLRAHRDSMRQKLGVPPDATLFLLVGSGYVRKGVAAVLTALSRLPGNTHLLVVGRDKARGHYKRMARRLGIASRVALVGAQDDPKPFYGAADVFVLPTLYDPCPNAALEAMACGLPVVTSTKCGAAELVLEHDAGFVCDAGDLDALTAHMSTLTDAEARTGRGERAREAVLTLTPEA